MKLLTHRQFAVFAAAAVVSAAGVSVILTGCSGNNSAATVFSSVSGAINHGQGDSGGGNVQPGDLIQDVQAGVQTFQDVTMDPQCEDAIGQGVAVALTSTHPLVQDDKLNDYVALVGYTVGEAALPGDHPLLFGVLDTDDVGAFSGPNGYVLITRGALLQMHDEAELAGVLSHELTHVAKHDGFNAVKAAKLQGDLARDASLAARNQDENALINVAADSGYNFVVLGHYDHDQEFAADRGAVDCMADAGYDPASYQRFMQRIADEQGTGNRALFSTHPDFASRLQAVSSEIDSIGKRGVGQTNADRFIAATASIRQ